MSRDFSQVIGAAAAISAGTALVVSITVPIGRGCVFVANGNAERFQDYGGVS